MQEGEAKYVKAKWSNDFYKKQNNLYYLYLDEPEQIAGGDFRIIAQTFGSMIALQTDQEDKVNKFYNVALENGAKDEGAPGIRRDGNFYAYIRDLDGNKLAVRFVKN